jgi:hypothetical protein
MQLKNVYALLQEFLFNCITFSHELGRKLQEEDKLTFPLFKQEYVSIDNDELHTNASNV